MSPQPPMQKQTSEKIVKPNQPLPFAIPDLTIKDLLSAIPKHCFERSAIRSMSYVFMDFALLAGIYKSTVALENYINPTHLSLPFPILYDVAWYALWTFYTFAAGLVATGLWVIAHECGHQAFSEKKWINSTVGWILHSALGVPYHSWRISHAKHHAATAHLTLDQVFVPHTRSQLGLKKLDPSKEDLYGSSVSSEAQTELFEAIGDSPLVSAIRAAGYLLIGWPMYLIRNASGQKWYPSNVNHFVANAPLYAPHQAGQIFVSDVGIILWVASMATFAYNYGVSTFMRVYFLPYLWVNHWLVLITFLQHTDPVLPHYRAPEFTFPRGALSTLDRHLLGDLGPIGAWLGATLTHGISETHVLHHVSSKIPHYNAWEASRALHKLLKENGLHLQGAPGGWSEMYRCFKECKFVEDEGNVVFYKNARGLAARVPVMPDSGVSDSGIDLQ